MDNKTTATADPAERKPIDLAECGTTAEVKGRLGTIKDLAAAVKKVLPKAEWVFATALLKKIVAEAQVGIDLLADSAKREEEAAAAAIKAFQEQEEKDRADLGGKIPGTDTFSERVAREASKLPGIESVKLQQRGVGSTTFVDGKAKGKH